MPSHAPPPANPPSGSRDRTAASADEPVIIGHRYRLERRIGQGGMSEVWVASDLQLDRRVAVKWLRSNLADDPVVAERFRREAIAVARLNHPNIVAVHDVFEHGGRQAVVMQLVDGRSLRQLLDTQRRLGPELTIHIGAAIASALDEAHRAGLVHRDVKPANILLTSDGRVMLADFGIAKGLGPSADDLTNDNVMMGTAKYLSPEQVRGKKLDGRADLYSLGLVLYECLAGRVPFIGESDADTALARLQRDPTDLNRLRPTLPVGLVDLVHRLLARNPAHRPATGQELRTALLAVDTTPVPIDPTPSTFGRRPGRETRRSTSSSTSSSSTSSSSTGSATSSAAVSTGWSTPATTAPTDPLIPGEPTRSAAARDITPVADGHRRDRDLTPPAAPSISPAAIRGLYQRRRTSVVVIGLLLAIGAVVGATVWAGLGTERPGDLPAGQPTAPDEGDPTVDGSGDPEVDQVDGSAGDADAGAGQTDGGAVDTAEPGPALTLPDSGPVSISRVVAWDPDGDSAGENDELAPLALAGADPAGGWPTLCYGSEYLGGKRGVGLIVSLSGAAGGRLSVESFNSPFWIEIYASPSESPPATLEAWGTSLTGDVFREEAGVVESDIPDGSRHALVWLRQLGDDPACSSTNPYRGRLGNLTFSG